MSTAEVAEQTGVSVATVTRWAVSGKLPPVYKREGLRGFYMFHRNDVEALQTERTE